LREEGERGKGDGEREEAQTLLSPHGIRRRVELEPVVEQHGFTGVHTQPKVEHGRCVDGLLLVLLLVLRLRLRLLMHHRLRHADLLLTPLTLRRLRRLAPRTRAVRHLDLLNPVHFQKVHGRIIAAADAAALLVVLALAAALARVEVRAAQVRGRVVVRAVDLAVAAVFAGVEEFGVEGGGDADVAFAHDGVRACDVAVEFVSPAETVGSLIAVHAHDLCVNRTHVRCLG
jgi:hypothetical protein